MQSLMKNPLLDKEFLELLDEDREKEVWVRIIALTFDEQPVEEITGRFSNGNIGIDGSSSVRRTCSLSMTAEKASIHDYYWGLNNKFRLEIGLTNNINLEYPDIIWFNKGIYVITSFNSSHSTSQYTISIQGQDKMCLLNGTIGGSLTAASTDFGTIEYLEDNGITRIVKIPIKTIIKEGVHEYAKEPWHNIIVNDLDDYGLELLEYRGREKPMYLFINSETSDVLNMTLNKNQTIYLANDKSKSLTIADFEEAKYQFDNRIQIDLDDSIVNEPTLVCLNSTNTALTYSIAKIEYGQTVGYRLTDIVYAGDLIAAAGEPFTAVLDKIVAMLGNFEYFYDVDGRFIFQKKKTYIDTSWNNIVDNRDETYVENAANTSAIDYEFTGSKLVSAFTNSPQINNVKNDYSIWGVRKSITGQELPVHLRYAIDKKPVYYKTIGVTEEDCNYYNKLYGTNVKPVESKVYTSEKYDWRELIYQMALDYRKFNHWDIFLTMVRDNNIDEEDNFYYPSGYTGYEQYYIDMEGFWRQLYDPNQKDSDNYDSFGWNKMINDSPEMLNFWFDFLDSQSELSQFAVSVIGNRPKVTNDNNVKSIYFRETPTVIFVNSGEN